LGSPTLGAPVAFSSPTLNRPPKINTSAKCSRIVHRELVANISGNQTYGVVSFALNPGLPATFPWLSTVASSYEQYTFRSLRFHYVTRCATSYTGSVLLSPEYDALDSAPTSEIIQAMMAGSVEDVPWRDQVLTFSPQDMFPMGPRKFTRSSAVASSDLKTYDVGQLFVGLAGCTDANTIGKLWVEYDVELYIPQNPLTGNFGGIGSSALLTLHATESLLTGVAKLISFDTIAYDGISVTNTGGSIVLPAGTYAVETMICTNGNTPGGLDTSVLIEIRKNGSASFPVYNSTSIWTGHVTTVATCSTCFGNIVSASGTDAVSVYATVTNATGGNVLTAVADNCQIRIIRVA